MAIKRKTLNALIRRFNKLKYTKPKTVRLKRINVIDRRWAHVMTEMMKNPKHPKISVYKTNFSKNKVPFHYLLEGSHRSFIAKITGRPVVLRKISKKTKYGPGGSDPRHMLDDLTEKIDRKWGNRFSKGDNWDTKTIKLRAVREKKDTPETIRLYNKIKEHLKKRWVRQKQWQKDYDINLYNIKKSHKFKVRKDTYDGFGVLNNPFWKAKSKWQ